MAFTRERGIGTWLLLETCFHRVFEMGFLMQRHAIRCYAVPNIEMVRRSEVAQHSVFTGVLCGNQHCFDTLARHGVPKDKLHLVLFSIFDPLVIRELPLTRAPRKLPRQRDGILRFFVAGGLNANCRKNCAAVLEAFLLLNRQRKIAENAEDGARSGKSMQPLAAQLVCCIQGKELPPTSLLEEVRSAPNIELRVEQHTYRQMVGFYTDSHIVIQVSKHEGLGLGFHEALALAIPVLSIDHAPHNEIIRNQLSGVLLPCTAGPMCDNQDGLVESAYVEPHTIADAVRKLCSQYSSSCNNSGPSALDAASLKAHQFYTGRFRPEGVRRRFLKALGLSKELLRRTRESSSGVQTIATPHDQLA
jgi:glycosyltransferase involved in cell wall biosynthesis